MATQPTAQDPQFSDDEDEIKEHDEKVLEQLKIARDVTRQLWRETFETFKTINQFSKQHKATLRQNNNIQHRRDVVQAHVSSVVKTMENCFKQLHFAHYMQTEQIESYKTKNKKRRRTDS